MTMSMGSSTALLLCSYLLSIAKLCSAIDTISRGQSIRGNETVVSAEGRFELGYFSPGDPKNLYLGIWYKNISVRTVVWVANREIPLSDSSPALQLTHQGILVLLNHNESIIWSSNSSRLVQNPIAQLLDSGNLVVRDVNDKEPEHFLWQSFDHPCDTFIPGMKLGRSRTTGFDRVLTSWKNREDPSPGNFTYRADPNGYPQLVLSQGSVIKNRIELWNNLNYSGNFNLQRAQVQHGFGFVVNDKEIYYSYELLNTSDLERMTLSSSGVIQRYMLSDLTKGWILHQTAQIDNCENYAMCGAYGSCNVVNSPLCQCLNGFVPKFHEKWDRMDWSDGCVRRTPLDCKTDVFFKSSVVTLPDGKWFNMSLNVEDCKMICQRNCSCTAYTTLDLRGGCFLWFVDLIDIQELAGDGLDLNIRMASSESEFR